MKKEYILYENGNFVVEAWNKTNPHIDRDEGGHIVIFPKVKVKDRQHLSPKLAIELMRLTIIVGEAMTKVMNNHGVDIGRINYQDNGNWGVFKPKGSYLHVHLYGRAKSATVQKYGQAAYFPHIKESPEYYNSFKQLTGDDIADIRKKIADLFSMEKYKDTNWLLNN